MLVTYGELNTAIGAGTLLNLAGDPTRSILDAEQNIAFGAYAGYNLTTGNHNILIGYNIEAPNATGDNQLNIGNVIYGTTVDGVTSAISSANSKIGIGTSAPEAKLEVQGGENEDASFALDADEGDDATDTWFIKSQAADNDLTFTNDVTELVRIMDNGNVGIGTNNPGEKLEVNGNVMATAFIATATAADCISNVYLYNTTTPMCVPDYVFEGYYDNNKKNNPQYEMMKLSDLEKYLQKNKHLPRVPSREEILKDESVNLQGLAMISLEKIEENMLYIIELEKKINEQNIKIAANKIRLQKLEAMLKSE